MCVFRLIMQDKYAEGVVSITDLIEAENDRFNKELSAFMAVYDFLSDLTSLDRYLESFTFLESEEEAQSWEKKVKAYLYSGRVIRGFKTKRVSKIL